MNTHQILLIQLLFNLVVAHGQLKDFDCRNQPHKVVGPPCHDKVDMVLRLIHHHILGPLQHSHQCMLNIDYARQHMHL